ncbi:hypothetical protein IU459_25890 [Nocardia amamiensis]|uniref:ATP synthase subunit I n=1 Tax=Nocardia amamiensis TaxID=404578 RepID=A0ABS0CWH5_9NOCA|nr:hypothetical protein [Nocardia amamiensis]MBF6300951.1 hypothetical protein [Nocardia amamiensis]
MDRRPIIVSAGAGIVVLAVAGLLDRLLLGVFVCAGMALGYVNAWLTQVAVAWISHDPGSGKQRLAATSGVRLFGVTALALVVSVLTRPDGFGILFGLVAFQITLLLRVAMPVLRGAR